MSLSTIKGSILEKSEMPYRRTYLTFVVDVSGCLERRFVAAGMPLFAKSGILR